MDKHEELKSLFDTLSDEQKAPLLYGAGAWHFHGIGRKVRPIELHDGPLGLRKVSEDVGTMGLGESLPATCFPAPCLLACSWDLELEKRIGTMMGLEARDQKTQVILAPGVNIKRNPLCGRNFEYFSEDPYLSGKMGGAFISGVQSVGVGTSLKHFACNNQETERMISDSIVDERTLQEIYLKPFGLAIKDGDPWTVMSSYNKINGVYASDNDYLLKDVLRGQFGFQGLVMSDWGGTNDYIDSHNHGLDVEMPCPWNRREQILRALEKGQLKHEEFDSCARHVIELSEKVNSPQKEMPFSYGLSHKAAVEAVAESAVLLKNDGILPLTDLSQYCLIGALAKTPRYQGNGSSGVNPLGLVSFLDFVNVNRDSGEEIKYAPGYSLEEKKDGLLLEAVDLASKSRGVLLFLGLPSSKESEGYDRFNMDLPEEQITLVNELAKVNSNIVVVLSCGSPVELPFLSKIRGLFLIYLGGEGASEGLFRLLTGKQSPSGHLAETWPLHYYDVPNRDFYPGKNRQALYKDGLFVGYRYYESCEKEVAFPFGFGLSYCSFKFGLVSLSSLNVKDSSPFVASLSVENVSDVAGKCVVQLYIHPIGSHLVRPLRELKAFKKISLKPHEKQEVEFDLDRSIFSHYDTKSHAFAVEPLTYRIEIGESSLDIRSSQAIEVSSSYNVDSQRATLPDYYFVSGRGMDVPQKEFETLLGHPVHVISNPKVRPYGMNSTLGDIDGTLIGKIAKKLIVKSLTKNARSEAERNMTLEGSLSSPFRAGTMAGVKENYLAAVVDLANRKPFQAIYHLLFGGKI